MHRCIPHNGDQTDGKGDSGNDGEGIKVNAIFFSKRAEIRIHKIIHFNYILSKYFILIYIIVLFYYGYYFAKYN
jgi:hypothetical protein